MAISITKDRIQDILLASGLGHAGGQALKPGWRMATFAISDIQLVSVNPHDIVYMIRCMMDRYNITEITSTWKCQDGLYTVFAGPVQTNDALTGILLTRKVVDPSPDDEYMASREYLRLIRKGMGGNYGYY